MELKYKNTAWREIFDKMKLRPNTVKNQMGYSTDITLRRWLNGKDCYITKMCDFCNKYGVDFLEFFTINGHPAREYLKNELELDFKQHLCEQNTEIPSEDSEQLKGTITDLRTRLRLTELEVQLREQDKYYHEREKLWETERQTLEEKYEKRLKELNDENVKLRVENELLKQGVSRPLQNGVAS